MRPTTISTTEESSSAIFQGYSPPASVYDEMYTADGTLREHWRPFVDAMEQLGPHELSRRWEQADRLIRENGVTYNAYGSAGGAERPWNLDALPLLIRGEEWNRLEAGLVQRATLLNMIVSDIYGPQHLLTSGALPAGLVFSHPGFMRPLHGSRPQGGCYIQVCAFDLARTPDGHWWVVGDRSDAPLGMGYALENRIVMSRMLPGVIRQCNVERLASFFMNLRDTLRRLAPEHRENPRIVLLTEGPENPNYFEDSYLARYLGYTLVEGGDLTARNDSIFLKTLGGLLPVDVIFRRLGDKNCDPLELRGEPSLGVAGLVEAVRAGNVAVANSLGSSLVESPAVMPYLPSLCRHLLGEELKVPNAATWWCGTKQEEKYVVQHLDQLQIRSAYRLDRQDPVSQEPLSGSMEQLASAIAAAPHRYAAQERVSRSSTPVWLNRLSAPMRVGLRVFLVKTKTSYAVLPGGLLRVSRRPGQLDASILAGEVSKDVWVLADRPVKDLSLLSPAGRALELRRTGAELPSRVADNLFWLGRFIERAEGTCRLLRPVLVRLTGEAEAADIAELMPLLHCLAGHGQIEPGFVIDGIKQQLPAIEGVLPNAVLNIAQPDSLRSTVAAMHRNASLVRDRISLDCWRIIHGIELQMDDMAGMSHVESADLLEMLDRVVIDLAAVDGLVVESMTRTQAFRFLDLGRRLERSFHTIALVRSALATVADDDGAMLESVLEVADSIMTYRARYLANLQLPPVLDLLLTDETNPRSLAYQLALIADHVENLPRDETQPLRGPEQRIALSALNSIRMIDNDVLREKRTPGKQTSVDQMLLRLAGQLPKLADLINHKYLVHAVAPRQLAEPNRK